MPSPQALDYDLISLPCIEHAIAFLAIGLSAAGTGCGLTGYGGLSSSTDAGQDAARGGDSSVGCLPQTLSEGLVAHFPFDGNAIEVIANANGTEVGVVTYGPGHEGLAVVLNGIDSLVQTPVVVTAEQDYTVSFWVRTSDIGPGNASSLWATGLGLVDGEVCGIPVGGDGGISLVNGGRIGTSFAGQSEEEINDDQWHFIVGRLTRATGVGALYIDGQFVSDRSDNPPYTFENVPYVGIGNDPCGVNVAESYFAGSIDELRFHDRALNDAEIQQLADCSP